MFEFRAGDLDVVGEVEDLAEGPQGNSPMQEFARPLLVRTLMPDDEKRVLLLHKLNLFRREACKSHRDPIVVVAGSLDVVGRPIRRGLNPR
jgi:hypothetical protein